PVVVAGKPEDSRLVLLIEHKDKPKMPPSKAKFQPSKEEIKLVRAWIVAGAKDDSASVKVELPSIKPKRDSLPPVTALLYRGENARFLVIARNEEFINVFFNDP